jgi:hypothetical protein
MASTEQDGKILSAIKSPMIFNAFSIISIGSIATASAITGHVPILEWVAICWIGGMTVWVNWQAAHDPRSLTYGPHEYLEESRLAHQRQMAAMRLTTQKSKGQQ